MNIETKNISILIFMMLLSLRMIAGENLKIGRSFPGKGLGACSYTSICKDSSGFIWIGTDNGLYRFDGVHYYSYRHEEADPTSISDNRILGLLSDNKNGIWVATANGLNKYEEDTNSFIRIKIKDFGENGYILSMTLDEEGKLTFVVSGVGIFSIYRGKHELSAIELPFADMVKNVNCILSSSDFIYAGTKEGYVCELKDGVKWEKVVELSSGIKEIVKESEYSLLISANDGLYRLSTGSKMLKKITIPSNIRLTSFSETFEDRVFIGTSKGIWRIENGSNSVEYCSGLYTPTIDINESRIGAVYVSHEGNLWVGCDFEGVILFPYNDYSFLYRKIDTLSPDFSVPISSSDVWKSNIVVGNDKGMVIVLSEEGKLIWSFCLPEGKAVSSICVNGDKALLGVVESGVWEADLTTGNLKKILDIPEKTISIVPCQGEDGNIYVGVYGKGLLKFDPISGNKELLTRSLDGKEKLRPFFTSITASEHLLWLGFYGGLTCYNTKKMCFEDIEQSPFVAGATYSVVTEKEGSVLVATSKGLIRYNKADNKISRITTLDGLPDNDVRSIVIDKAEDIWLGTMNGLSHIDRDFNTISNFMGGNGMEEIAIEGMGYFDDGNMMVAFGRKGITWFNPDAVPTPEFESSLKITGIFVKGKEIIPASMFGDKRKIEGPHTSPNCLNLPHDENSIALRLSTLDFRDTSNLRYFWRLSGDGEWNSLSPGEDMIHLTSLSYGSHYLEYKAIDSGVESPVSVLRINIAHPWYLSWQAKLFYILMLLIFVSFIWIMINKIRKERLFERKMQLIMDVSHDMRSPLTLILQPLESLLNEELRSDVRNRIRTIYCNAHRILNLANQLLELKKIDHGKKKLECRLTNLPGFIGDIMELLKPQALDKGITMTLHLSPDISEVWIDRSILDRILVNIISNAIKYTQKNGRIEVTGTFEIDEKLGDCLTIKVMDTGIGLEKDSSTDLFDQFQRLPNGQSFTEDGYGLGMDICRRYIALHHGKIKAENRRDGVKGSVFSICIPTGKKNYTSEELIDEGVDTEKSHLIEFDKESILHSDDEKTDLPNKKIAGYANRRILLVEDDLALSETICNYLQFYFKVYTAGDGREGYRIAKDLIPDVIVTDVKMPNEDGIQMLRNLKDNPETAYIPVVILSQKNELVDRLAGWRGGAEAYVSKPFVLSELKAIITKLIDCRTVLREKYTGELDIVTSSDGNTKSMRGHDKIFMDRLNSILDDKLDKADVNVEWLAKEIGISRSQLHRKLKEHLGLSPSDLIRNIRLKRASELLKKGDLEITQIAYSLGFSSLPQFSTSFKRFKGCTPSEYRSRYMEKSEKDKS